jgi:hypothetical protein
MIVEVEIQFFLPLHLQEVVVVELELLLVDLAVEEHTKMVIIGEQEIHLL